MLLLDMGCMLVIHIHIHIIVLLLFSNTFYSFYFALVYTCFIIITFGQGIT